MAVQVVLIFAGIFHTPITFRFRERDPKPSPNRRETTSMPHKHRFTSVISREILKMI
jgi:hypothetical protein